MKKLYVQLLMILLLLPAVSLADTHRRDLPMPADRIFDQMLKYYARENYKGLQKSLEILEPLVNELDQKFNTNLKTGMLEAIEARNLDGFSDMLLQLVFLDMKDLLMRGAEKHEVSGHSRGSKSEVKKAYMSFLLLSKHRLAGIDFVIDQKLRKEFQKLTLGNLPHDDFKKQQEAIVETVSSTLGYSANYSPVN